MKTSLLTLLVLLVSIYSNITQANTPSVINDKADKISPVIEQLMQKDHISGAAVAIIDHGKKSIYVFGKTNSANAKPIAEKTPFELGSLTKLMTTLVLSEEIQKKQAKLTDPLTDYMPQLSINNNLKKVTLEQLATHTSGFPSFVPVPASIKTEAQLTRYLLDWKPNEIKWQYSNLGIGLLGESLAKKNHQSIYQLFESNIFSPLNMTTSAMAVRPSPQFFPAAWAVKSTIADMSDFLAAAIGLPNTPKNIFLAMQFAQTPRVQVGNMKQALGWQVYSLRDRQKLLDISQYKNLLTPLPMKKLPKTQQHYDPDTLIDKTGGTNGFRSYIVIIPSQQSGIVLLFNKRIPDKDIVYAGRKILFMF